MTLAEQFAKEVQECGKRFSDWNLLLRKWDLKEIQVQQFDALNKAIMVTEVRRSMQAFKWDTSYPDDVPVNLVIMLACVEGAVVAITEWLQRIHDGEGLPEQWSKQLTLTPEPLTPGVSQKCFL